MTIKQTLIIICIAVVTSLTSCVMCSACSSTIENKTNADIYIILKADNKYGINVFKHFLKDSHLSKFNLDTLTNTGTFIIPSGGHLLTYDGPGNNPARILTYLQIITTKEIKEMKVQNDIENAYEKFGVNYKLTIE